MHVQNGCCILLLSVLSGWCHGVAHFRLWWVFGRNFHKAFARMCAKWPCLVLCCVLQHHRHTKSVRFCHPQARAERECRSFARSHWLSGACWQMLVAWRASKSPKKSHHLEAAYQSSGSGSLHTDRHDRGVRELLGRRCSWWQGTERRQIPSSELPFFLEARSQCIQDTWPSCKRGWGVLPSCTLWRKSGHATMFGLALGTCLGLLRNRFWPPLENWKGKKMRIPFRPFVWAICMLLLLSSYFQGEAETHHFIVVCFVFFSSVSTRMPESLFPAGRQGLNLGWWS